MKMINKSTGESVYYNLVTKNGKCCYLVKGIGDTLVFGRDRQKRKSRVFTQEAQAERYLERHGFEAESYE